MSCSLISNWTPLQLEPGGAVSNFRRDNIVPYVYAVNTMDEGECGGTQNLFVATRLAPFYDWIESIILRHLPENDPILTCKYIYQRLKP